MQQKKMSKRIVLMMTLLLNVAVMLGRPAYSKPIDILQPDGTTVTLVMHGDEFQSFTTTADGYTVVKGSDGFYRYAVRQGHVLAASAFVARNAEVRQETEKAFLNNIQKMERPEMSETGKQWKKQISKMYRSTYDNLEHGQRRAITPGTISERIDYSKFKGLVLLVNWSDKTFKMQAPQGFYQKLTSERNYKDDSKSVYPFNIKGSVRDYFYDNSLGIFDPTFDVTGPITINISCEYPWPKDELGNVRAGWGERAAEILKAVMTEADKTVDFNNYDLNNDGFVDMVYIIFAGYGSYMIGNNMKYMWPHANNYADYNDAGQRLCDYFNFPSFDGKKFGRYACGVEIQDYESQSDKHAYADGIGTMCHEFSHVLGLADHYGSFLAHTPGKYDLMDDGVNFNQGLSPVGYSAFERYVLGFADNTVTTLEVAGNYSLEPFNTSNKAFIVKTKNDGEVFYVENRQKQGWDESLPKHGLLVWRVDTSDPQKFISNTVNVGMGDECLQLVGNAPYMGIDLMPATNASWRTKEAAIDLFDITTNGGVISFQAGKDLYPLTIEDFEATPLSESGATGVAGKFCSWDLTNAAVVQSSLFYGNGEHVVRLQKDGMLSSSAIEKDFRSISFRIRNSEEYNLRVFFRTSTDGTTWTALPTAESYYTIPDSEPLDFLFCDIPKGTRFQIAVTTDDSKHTSATCYVDDIVVTYKKDATGIETVKDKNIDVHAPTYNMAGQRVDKNFKGLVIKGDKKFVIK